MLNNHLSFFRTEEVISQINPSTNHTTNKIQTNQTNNRPFEIVDIFFESHPCVKVLDSVDLDKEVSDNLDLGLDKMSPWTNLRTNLRTNDSQ